ncbi:MAG: YncE family protein [Flavobacteriales bacterium]|nr:MAG: YncE family protein [Flavobacteriales bacterium]
MNKLTKSVKVILLIGLTTVLWSCRKERGIVPEEQEQLPGQDITAVNGFYLLNEGNWGSGRASLDYFDYASGIYKRNIHGQINPDATLGLGDVGNDIQIYGSKLYIVVNASNKLEILDVKTAQKLGEVDIANCRYVTFHKSKAYVTAYEGVVAVIDTASFKLETKIPVGQQPEEMAVIGEKLYVANSGGYNAPNYERTISVIDLNTNKEVKKIDVGINLHRLKVDQYGDIYVTSRGDYNDIKSALYVIDSKTETVKKKFDIAASNLAIDRDFAYIIGTAWSNATQSETISYAKVNVKDETILSGGFITDGTDKDISKPYGIAVDPLSSDIFVTDARDYVTPGKLHCFDKTGKKKFDVTTGDIPAHLVFYTKK